MQTRSGPISTQLPMEFYTMSNQNSHQPGVWMYVAKKILARFLASEYLKLGRGDALYVADCLWLAGRLMASSP